VRDAAPTLPLYGQLRDALARYSALGDHPAWQQPLPAPPRGKLEPGQPYAGLAVLADRLRALGDLPPQAQGERAPQAPGPPVYEGELVDALRGFQQRHALAPDGILGRATLAQLQVGPAARVRQIELMLERLRWTPLMQAPRMIVINIPEFVLRAYEVQDGRIRLREQMKVIVGKAMDTRTPLFDEQMRAVEFSPYWNVPPSIARNELVPRLRRDAGHFEREGFEFVGAGAAADTGVSAERLDAVLAGRLRIRQRPGPRNALGGIKFVFPNRENIYLHHTPSRGLFERERRDFSHGCIRVEQPLALARFVLQDQPEWTEARIRQAMADGPSFTLRLAEPVPVVIAYGTALVKDGKLHFFEDLYGHDRRLDAALREHTRKRPPLP
jgi:murein L,D-transpeptidase YcbB/YkuD